MRVRKGLEDLLCVCVCHWKTVLETNDLVFWEIKCEDRNASVLQIGFTWKAPLGGLQQGEGGRAGQSLEEWNCVGSLWRGGGCPAARRKTAAPFQVGGAPPPALL